MRLPWHHFDTNTNKVEGIISPAKTKIHQSVRKARELSAIIEGGSQFFYTPARTGSRNTQPA